ncbi:flavin reductase family protein [Candidatus Roizmanbacteria bacterium]|nr:flavin reductase family protein [Candidatus Roizmanbacteria bacterium]
MDEDSIYKALDLTMPWAVGLVITKRENKINVCPVTFQVISSIYEKPYVVCIGLSNTNYTLETILKTKEFTYAYPSIKQLKDTLFSGTVSGRNMNKISKTSFEFTKASKISSPHLNGAIVNFECKLDHAYRLERFTIVVGKIVHAQFDRYKKIEKLQKIYALGDFDYGVIEKINVIQSSRT